MISGPRKTTFYDFLKWAVLERFPFSHPLYPLYRLLLKVLIEDDHASAVRVCKGLIVVVVYDILLKLQYVFFLYATVYEVDVDGLVGAGYGVCNKVVTLCSIEFCDKYTV